MKKLIVYLSDLEKGHKIIEYAEQVAIRLKSNIQFIYNIDSETETQKKEGDNGSSEKENEERIVEEKKNEIGQLVECYNWTDTGIEVVYSVFNGYLKKIFKTLASSDNSELVLFPVNRETKAADQKLIMQVLGSIKSPVWCFSPGQEYRPIKTIVYASNYKKEDIEVIKSLSAIAKGFEAKINVLHIFKRKKFKQQLIDAGLKDLINKKIDYPAVEISSKKKRNVASGVSDFCKAKFADVVVVMKKDKFLFRRLLGKSSVEKILKKIDLPVIIYPK